MEEQHASRAARKQMKEQCFHMYVIAHVVHSFQTFFLRKHKRIHTGRNLTSAATAMSDSNRKVIGTDTLVSCVIPVVSASFSHRMCLTFSNKRFDDSTIVREAPIFLQHVGCFSRWSSHTHTLSVFQSFTPSRIFSCLWSHANFGVY